MQHFAVFGFRIGFGGDAAARADVIAALMTDGCADHDVEGCVPCGRKITDGAGIESARSGFQSVEYLHGPVFRRTGNRPAGKSGPQQIRAVPSFASVPVMVEIIWCTLA